MKLIECYREINIYELTDRECENVFELRPPLYVAIEKTEEQTLDNYILVKTKKEDVIRWIDVYVGGT